MVIWYVYYGWSIELQEGEWMKEMCGIGKKVWRKVQKVTFDVLTHILMSRYLQGREKEKLILSETVLIESLGPEAFPSGDEK